MKLGALRDGKSRTGTMDSRAVTLMVKDISIGDIQTKENVRKEYTGIDELAASIRQYGLLQPITVYPKGEGYIVKTGHRRFKAIQALYQKEADRFHSIRCIVSDADNTTIIQLVENIQRVDLPQVDLLNALNDMKDQGITNKQIAGIVGKSEGYIKNLFMGVNEINSDDNLKNLISHAGVTIQDIGETKGIPDKQDRLKLLEQRGNRQITRSEMREKVKALKTDNPPVESPVSASDVPAAQVSTGAADTLDPQVAPETGGVFDPSAAAKDRLEPSRIQISIKRLPEQRSIVVCLVNIEDEGALISIEDDLRTFFIAHDDQYSLV
jgi:ParB family chromosome partitioning protein